MFLWLSFFGGGGGVILYMGFENMEVKQPLFTNLHTALSVAALFSHETHGNMPLNMKIYISLLN